MIACLVFINVINPRYFSLFSPPLSFLSCLVCLLKAAGWSAETTHFIHCVFLSYRAKLSQHQIRPGSTSNFDGSKFSDTLYWLLHTHVLYRQPHKQMCSQTYIIYIHPGTTCIHTRTQHEQHEHVLHSICGRFGFSKWTHCANRWRL